MEDAGDNGGEGQIPWPGFPAVEDPVETEPAGHSQGCQGMSVGQCPSDGDEVTEVVVDNTTLEQGPEGTDEVRRHFGEVGDGFAPDPLSFPP